MTSKFNEAISIDLKVWDKCCFLVIIDLATQYCTEMVIYDLSVSTKVKSVFLCWIKLFGIPANILTDNDCEFSNNEMCELDNAFNIKIMTTVHVVMECVSS